MRKKGLFAGLIAAALCSPIRADTSAFTIIDDTSQTNRVQQVVDNFLNSRSPRSGGVSYVNVTMLTPNGDGSWTRVGVNQDAITYPASCVKLAYLASAMHWSRTNGLAYSYLDENYSGAVSDMIVNSSNFNTGVVVDLISGEPNDQSITSTGSPGWTTWYEGRLYTEDFLLARGLLGPQTILHKTYPSNSPFPLVGAEEVALDFRGSNRMNPRLSASLMLEIVEGAIEPQATDYMKSLLETPRWDDDSSFGYGRPPGTTYLNKIGVASGTLEDIAYIQLPNDQELILAAFTDSFDPAAEFGYDAADLGMLAEALIEEFDLDVGNPPKVVLDNDDGDFFTTGNWTVGTFSTDRYGSDYRFALGNSNATAGWNLDLPQAGTYEVTALWSQGNNRADNAQLVIEHDGGTEVVTLNQTINGGRWYRLGDYQFTPGSGRIYYTTNGTSSTEVTIADAVKLSMFPNDNDTTSANTWLLY